MPRDIPIELSEIPELQMPTSAAEYQYDRTQKNNGKPDWERFLRRDPKYWKSPNLTQLPSPDKKRKLILNNFAFSLLDPNHEKYSLECDLIEKIINEYEVYFWVANPASLKKIHNFHEFLFFHTDLNPASSKPIKSYLVENNLKLDDYLIIDFPVWVDIAKSVSQQITKKEMSAYYLASCSHILEMDKSLIRINWPGEKKISEELQNKIILMSDPLNPIKVVDETLLHQQFMEYLRNLRNLSSKVNKESHKTENIKEEIAVKKESCDLKEVKVVGEIPDYEKEYSKCIVMLKESTAEMIKGIFQRNEKNINITFEVEGKYNPPKNRSYFYDVLSYFPGYTNDEIEIFPIITKKDTSFTRNVKRLSVKDLSIKDGKNFFSGFENLQSLRFEAVNVDAINKNDIPKLDSLVKLEAYDIFLTQEILSACINVKELTFSHIQVEHHGYLKKIDFPFLTNLRINSQLKQEDFKTFLKGCGELRTLTFTCCEEDENIYYGIIENLKIDNFLRSDLKVSSIPLFKPFHGITPYSDTETKTDPQKTLSGRTIFVDHKLNNVDISKNCTESSCDIFDIYREEKIEIVEIKKENRLKTEKQFIEQVKKGKNDFFGKYACVIKKDKWKSIPSLKDRTDDSFEKKELLYIEDIPKVLVGFEERTGQYYIKLDDSAEEPSKKITIRYILTVSSQKWEQKIDFLCQGNMTPNFQEMWNNFFYQNEKNYSDFKAFIRSFFIGPINIAAVLKGYFNNNSFKDAALLDDRQLKENSKKYHLDYDLLRILIQKKGACRHRAKACAYILHLLGFKNICIHMNDVHAWISFYNPQLKSHYHVDLGGVRVRTKTEPFIFGEENKTPIEKENDEDSIDEKKPFTLNAEREEEKNNDYMIWVQEQSEARKIYSKFKEKKPDIVTLYVDSADNLRQLLQDVKIDQNGGYRIVSGPLGNLIEKSKEKSDNKFVLMVNFSKFPIDDTDLALSMLDEERKIGNIVLPKNIQIIGVITPKTVKSDAFLSRISDHVSYAPDSIQSQNTNFYMPIQKENIRSEEDIIVDLCHSDDWNSILLGSIGLNEKGFFYKEGPFILALKNKKNLILKNPPNDNTEYELFIYRLQTERSIQINGEFYEISKDFKISHYDENTVIPENIAWNCEEKLTIENKDYYLNTMTFSSFLSYIHIDEFGAGTLREGYIAEYKPGDIIHVTAPLNASQWAMIYKRIEEVNNKTDKKITFRFAEDYKIPQKSPQSLDIKNIPERPLWISSSDPDYTASCLQEKFKIANKNIIYVSEKSDMSDFFGSISLSATNNGVRGFFSKGEIRERLKNGETVILAGNISQALYDNLISLFGDNAGLWVNGKYETYKGKLILISPIKDKLNGRPRYTHVTSLHDYAAYFKNRYPEIYIKKVMTFFSEVEKMPPIQDRSGRSTPLITAQRFKLALEMLKNKNGRENPIKQIFHNEYQGESYAQLNCMAKKIFSSDGAPSVRLEKLRFLCGKIKTVDDIEQYYWQIMNCFNGAAIAKCKILQKNSLFTLIKSGKYIEQVEKSFTKSPVTERSSEKRGRHIEYALNEPAYKIIFFQGPPGSGKTFSASELEKNSEYTIYKEENGMKSWLEHSENFPKAILILNEANMHSESYYNLLKGLKKGEIFYEGKTYKIKDNHKVIMTGNPPRDFPNRVHLDISDMMYIVNFKPLKIEFLRNNILEKMLTKEERKQAELLLRAYQEIQSIAPNHIFSARDIKDMILKYKEVCKQNPPEKAVYMAIAEKFRQHFKDEEKLLFWLNSLDKENTKLTAKDVTLPYEFPSHDNTFIVTDSRKKILASIELCFSMKDSNKIILLEGPSGIGKSRIAKYYFESKHLDYIHFPAGVVDGKALKEAVEKGKYILIDEYNIKQQQWEKIINQITDEYPSVKIIVTQNPAATHTGKELGADLNRMHRIPIERYPHAELLKIAFDKYHLDEKTAAQLIKEAKQVPWCNDRTYLQYFEKEVQKQTREYKSAPMEKPLNTSGPNLDNKPF